MASGTRDCNLNSAKRLQKQGGEWVAEPHQVPKTGYKAPNAYGATPVFDGMTTNKSFQSRVLTSVGVTDKKLCPYYPNAPRNRPPETLTNIPGKRFGLHVTRDSKETYRGSSKVKLADGDVTSKRPWKTTNQVFSECALVADTVGLSNQGISADVARTMHVHQWR